MLFKLTIQISDCWIVRNAKILLWTDKLDDTFIFLVIWHRIRASTLENVKIIPHNVNIPAICFSGFTEFFDFSVMRKYSLSLRKCCRIEARQLFVGVMCLALKNSRNAAEYSRCKPVDIVKYTTVSFDIIHLWDRKPVDVVIISNSHNYYFVVIRIIDLNTAFPRIRIILWRCCIVRCKLVQFLNIHNSTPFLCKA